MRVGTGFDAHKLVKDRRFVLGGVNIPYEYGLDGHSDGDVLAHAIIDAILGAASLGDIGHHFPSNDKQYENMSGLTLLGKVHEIISKHGWQIGNLDATIVAEHPRLTPHVERISQAISASLMLKPEQLNIKTKTTDGLGFTGRGEGIVAYAVACIEATS